MIFFSLGLFWFILINLIVLRFMREKSKNITKCITILSIYLLTYKSITLIYHLINKKFFYFPVDHSAVMYFLLPICCLFKNKLIKPFTVLGGFISGFGYMLGFILTGKLLLSDGLISLVLTLINHTALYIISILVMASYKVKKSDYWSVIGVTVIFWMYVIALNQLIDFSSNKLFILDLFLGSFLENIVSRTDRMFYIVNYLLLFGLYSLVILLFTRVNKFIYDYRWARVDLFQIEEQRRI